MTIVHMNPVVSLLKHIMAYKMKAMFSIVESMNDLLVRACMIFFLVALLIKHRDLNGKRTNKIVFLGMNLDEEDLQQCFIDVFKES